MGSEVWALCIIHTRLIYQGTQIKGPYFGSPSEGALGLQGVRVTQFGDSRVEELGL